MPRTPADAGAKAYGKKGLDAYSKYVGAERELVNWAKQQRKLMNAGELKESRIGMFKELMELNEKYKRKNQY